MTERGAHETELEIIHELGSEHEASSHGAGWGDLVRRLEGYLAANVEDR